MLNPSTCATLLVLNIRLSHSLSLYCHGQPQDGPPLQTSPPSKPHIHRRTTRRRRQSDRAAAEHRAKFGTEVTAVCEV